MKSSSDNENSEAPGLRIFALGALVAVVIWALTPFIAQLLSAESEIEKTGAWGDTFGSVNALFSGLALAAIIFALFVQRHEVRLLRDELNQSRKLVKEQQSALAKQNVHPRNSLSKRRFLNT